MLAKWMGTAAVEVSSLQVVGKTQVYKQEKRVLMGLAMVVEQVPITTQILLVEMAVLEQ